MSRDKVILDLFKADYVFEMARILHPKCANSRFISKLCNTVTVSEDERLEKVPCISMKKLREDFAAMLEKAIWKQIKRMAMKPAQKFLD
jgi:hypothetical protein